jgi:Tol biopolymer transport system component
MSGVFVIDVDGPDGLVRLADGSYPAWSPDGTKIAFASSRGASGFGIHVMNADGSDIERLTFPNDPSQCSEGSSANDLKPDWSPDGRKLLFERQISVTDGENDCGADGWGYVPNVYLVNADGTGVRRLRTLPLSTGDQDPAWSPDGHSIAFSTEWPLGVNIIDKDATSAAKPVAAAIPGISPVWSPDSKKLLVLSVSPPNNRLVIVELESGNTEVLSFPFVRGLLLDPAW